MIKHNLNNLFYTFTIMIIYSLINFANANVSDEYLKQIEEQVYDLIEEQLSENLEVDEKAKIEIQPISQVSIPNECEEELELTNVTGKIRRTNTIKVVCRSKTNPFSTYASAKVTIESPFVTVINPVTKNSTLDAGNLEIQYMNKVLDRGVTFKEIDPLIGVRTKRDLKPGEPIQKNKICVVCKGDEVFIEVQVGNLNIKTKGIADQDGSFNDKIRVKNKKSGKYVRGTIVDTQTIKVN